MQIGFLVLLFILGACLGSFLCCQARRLHLKSTHKKPLGPRSVCLKCHYQLKWYDNLPIISWLALRGKCRKCRRPIGAAELFSEIGIAFSLLFLGTTINPLTATPIEWAIFATALVLILALGFLAIYDGIYGELPNFCLTISIICAIIVLALKEWSVLSYSAFSPELIAKPLLSVLILGGVYLVLYLLSKGKWVGDGDWLLGTAIAIALADPWLALITLFLANLLASFIMYPLAKGQKQQKIHFGPFLVAAFIITYSFSDFFFTLLSF